MEIQIQSDSIELIDVNQLIPHEKNMHNHSPQQIERLCNLIEYQGFRNPLIIQKGTNVVVAGHGRLEAAKTLGMEKVPCLFQEFENEAQLYAYIVSDNAIGKDHWAQLDLSQVNNDIIDLGPDFDIDMLGLKNFSIEAMDTMVTDPLSEWDGMPEMGDNTSATEKAHGKIIVWFESEEYFEDFKERLGQNFSLGNGTTANSIWHPKK